MISAEACGYVVPMMEGIGGSELGQGIRRGNGGRRQKSLCGEVEEGQQRHFCSRIGKLQQLVD